MKFAPVIIPTLNRADHLQELVDSLKKNAYAKYTDLYISVDYPPNANYEAGYHAVKKYLQCKIEGFKNVFIYFQTANLGAFQNALFLVSEVGKRYDRYIITEDDNIFSPNFLEYMDKCLDKYEDNAEVIAVSGHIHDGIKNDSSNLLIMNSVLYDAWGVGHWVNKDKKVYEELTFSYLENILNDYHRAYRLYNSNKFFFRLCVDCVIKHKGDMFSEKGEFYLIDQILTIYLNDANKRVINPSVSKVKNCGDDGSGLHGGIEDIGRCQCIDDNVSYNIETAIELDNRKNLLDIYHKMFSNSWKRNLYTVLVWMRYYFLRKVHVNIKRLIKKY